jgi:ribosomal protein S18 acetylase RimI-like enzyme
MSREKCLEVIRLTLGDQFAKAGVDLDEHLSGFELYEFRPGVVVIERGREVHIAVHPAKQRRWASRKVLTELFAGLLDKHGWLVTVVESGNTKSHDFVQRLGFMPVAERGAVTVYTMEPACQFSDQ